MTNQNSLLKIVSLLVLLVLALLYVWPNIYREFPVVEISAPNAQASAELVSKVEGILKDKKLSYLRLDKDEANASVVFRNTDDQLLAKDAIQKTLGNDYTVALNLVSSMPDWLRSMGAGVMTSRSGSELPGPPSRRAPRNQ